jgi:hypothetical protein
MRKTRKRGYKGNGGSSRRTSFDLARQSELEWGLVQKAPLSRKLPRAHLSTHRSASRKFLRLRQRPGRRRPVDLYEIEDRRRYNDAPASTSGRRARVAASPNRSLASLQFTHPKHVVTCVRRRERREVIHATGKGGRKAPQKRPRYNHNSNIRCK